MPVSLAKRVSRAVTARTWLTLAGAPVLSSETVSYTHLDVYKRQVDALV